jgi:hypothetical protein
MKMILHQDITMHFHPVALRPLSEIAQKLPSISIMPGKSLPVDLRAPDPVRAEDGHPLGVLACRDGVWEAG